MAAVDQIGTTLIVGAGTISGNYIVESQTDGNFDVSFVDVDDEDGALVTRIILKRHKKVHLELICKTGAAPETDFIEGQIAAATDFTNYYVEAATISKSPEAQKVSVDLVNIGVTA